MVLVHGLPWARLTFVKIVHCLDLLHSWAWRVVKQLFIAVYRIQGPSEAKQQQVIVHFDRLKPCASQTVFITSGSSDRQNWQTRDTQTQPVCNLAKNVDDDDDTDVLTNITKL